nr:ankyrin repeat-containing protein [Tanacetum cinerariifolium]
FSNTAFWIAASTGNVNMAMIMMEKNRSLQYIRGLKYLPLSISALKGKYRTAKYLYDISQKMTGDSWTDEDRESILVDCVERELFEENRADYLEFGVPLYEASINGDWETAKLILDKRPELVRFGICRQLGTALHVAATADETKLTLQFVKNLKMTGDSWTDEDRESILVDCVERELFDVALQILNDRPELAATVSLLEVLARKPDAFTTLEKNIVMRIIDPVISSLPRFFHMKVKPAAEEDTDALKLMKIIWRNVCETADFEEIEDLLKGPPRILFVAAERGNARFIAEVLRTYPDLMFDENEDGLTIFHIAVMHRYHDIYNLMYEIGSVTNDICLSADPMGNFMHHLVGKSSKEMTAKMVGASLLMQRELLWFKEVEKIMPAYLTEEKNYEGQTAYELFSKENEDLVSSGLKWMKDCMVVATLIVTVAFAVAFTVPGGYRQETGFPFFIHDTSFLVFVIADAISLFFSTISLLVFLGVLTSRHGQRDFMYSLPRKLMIDYDVTSSLRRGALHLELEKHAFLGVEEIVRIIRRAKHINQKRKL